MILPNSTKIHSSKDLDDLYDHYSNEYKQALDKILTPCDFRSNIVKYPYYLQFTGFMNKPFKNLNLEIVPDTCACNPPCKSADNCACEELQCTDETNGVRFYSSMNKSFKTMKVRVVPDKCSCKNKSTIVEQNGQEGIPTITEGQLKSGKKYTITKEFYKNIIVFKFSNDTNIVNLEIKINSSIADITITYFLEDTVVCHETRRMLIPESSNVDDIIIEEVENNIVIKIKRRNSETLARYKVPENIKIEDVKFDYINNSTYVISGGIDVKTHIETFDYELDSPMDCTFDITDNFLYVRRIMPQTLCNIRMFERNHIIQNQNFDGPTTSLNNLACNLDIVAEYNKMLTKFLDLHDQLWGKCPYLNTCTKETCKDNNCAEKCECTPETCAANCSCSSNLNTCTKETCKDNNCAEKCECTPETCAANCSCSSNLNTCNEESCKLDNYTEQLQEAKNCTENWSYSWNTTEAAKTSQAKTSQPETSHPETSQTEKSLTTITEKLQEAMCSYSKIVSTLESCTKMADECINILKEQPSEKIDVSTQTDKNDGSFWNAKLTLDRKTNYEITLNGKNGKTVIINLVCFSSSGTVDAFAKYMIGDKVHSKDFQSFPVPFGTELNDVQVFGGLDEESEIFIHVNSQKMFTFNLFTE